MIRITGRGIVGIRAIGYGIAVTGVSNISGMVVIAIVAVVAVLTGAAGTADTSNIVGIASGRAVVVRKVGILAACVRLIASGVGIGVSPSVGEVGAVRYMVTVSGGYPHITRTNQRGSAGFPPISRIQKATVDPVIMIMTSIPLQILIGLAAARIKKTAQPIECNLA